MRPAILIISATEWREECLDIRIRSTGRDDSLAPIKAWRWREMAVHRKYLPRGGTSKAWRISHVPSGLSFGHDFASRGEACAAAVELDRLRNNWANIDGDDVRQMSRAALAILRRNGRSAIAPGSMTPRCNLNGYG